MNMSLILSNLNQKQKQTGCYVATCPTWCLQLVWADTDVDIKSLRFQSEHAAAFILTEAVNSPQWRKLSPRKPPAFMPGLHLWYVAWASRAEQACVTGLNHCREETGISASHGYSRYMFGNFSESQLWFQGRGDEGSKLGILLTARHQWASSGWAGKKGNPHISHIKGYRSWGANKTNRNWGQTMMLCPGVQLAEFLYVYMLTDIEVKEVVRRGGQQHEGVNRKWEKKGHVMKNRIKASTVLHPSNTHTHCITVLVRDHVVNRQSMLENVCGNPWAIEVAGNCL